jgi:hypothetical protein
MSRLLYPQLRNGLISAWAPCVDRSRSTLVIDQSIYSNHATMTNMDPATDWVARDGYNALDFDGSNDRFDFTDVVLGSTTDALWAISLWFRCTNAASYAHTLAYSSGFRGVRFEPGGVLNYRNNQNNDYSFTGLTYGSTMHIVLNASPGTPPNGLLELWVNGRFNASQTHDARLTLSRVGARGDGAIPFAGQIFDCRFYNRHLTSGEIDLLSIRPTIAYEFDRRRRAYVAGAGGGEFKSAWSVGSNIVIGV